MRKARAKGAYDRWRQVALLAIAITGFGLTALAEDPTATPASTSTPTSAATPTPCAGDARYWVGGTGAEPALWNDAAHWSCSSGGAAGATPPECIAAGDVYQGLNDCIWDENSGFSFSTENSPIHTTGMCCIDADWSAMPYVDERPTGGVYGVASFIGDVMYVSGSLLGSFGVNAALTGSIYLTATTGEHDVDPYVRPSDNGLVFHGSGTYGDNAVWNLTRGTENMGEGDVGGSANENLILGYGRLNLNGHFIEGYDIINGHGDDPADAFILDAGFGQAAEPHWIRIAHSWSIPSTTFIVGEQPCVPSGPPEACARLVFLENGTSCDPDDREMAFDGGGHTYYRIENWDFYQGAEWTVTGAATMQELYVRTKECSVESGCCQDPTRGDPVIWFEAGAQLTVTEQWDVAGVPAAPLVMRSSSPGDAWTVNCSATACASDYLVLSDSTCIGTCYAGSHSIDAGGNTDWIFEDQPTPTPTSTHTPTAVPPTLVPACCALTGNNSFGATCIDTVLLQGEPPVTAESCALLAEVNIDGDTVLHFNPASNCSVAGDWQSVCVAPATPTPTPTSVPPTLGPACCALAGNNSFGATCIDNALLHGEPEVTAESCALLAELNIDGDTVLHFNPASNCSVAGDPLSACMPPGTPTLTPTPTPTPVPPTLGPACCALAGNNSFGATCIDNALLHGEPEVTAESCALLAEVNIDGDTVLHFNPASNCSVAGDFLSACPPP